MASPSFLQRLRKSILIYLSLPMTITVKLCKPDDIREMRMQFLDEMSAQFIHNKCHLYGWSDDYLILHGGVAIGYGCVWGLERREDRDTIFEFYLTPDHRLYQVTAMKELIAQSGAAFLECQTNDPNTAPVFFEFARCIETQSILFRDSYATNFPLSGVVVKNRSLPEHSHREHLLELETEGEVIASGGLLLNYNPPYADVYMEVMEAQRRKGYGSLLVQEAKRLAYSIGRVPAARCRVNNHISRATLIRAGFQVCGYLLTGKVKGERIAF